MLKLTRAVKNTFSSLALIGLVGVAALATLPATATAQAQQVNAKAPPNDFIKTVADNALAALRADDKAKAGDLERINALVDEYILPYVDLEKTTRRNNRRSWSTRSKARSFAPIAARWNKPTTFRKSNPSHFVATLKRKMLWCAPSLPSATAPPLMWITAWRTARTAGKSTI